MPQQQPAIIASATSSEVENVPEIQALALRVEALSRSVDFWNQLMIWGLAVAAIAAVFIVVATRIVVSRSGQLSTAQDLLREAKDRQLQVDLSQKGIEIGNLKVATDAAEAEIATTRIELAKQQTRAATAERSLLELQERVKVRHLSPEQRKKLIDFLTASDKASIPKGPIAVTRLLMDETARPIAEEIKSALKEAGWDSPEVGKQYGGDATTPIGLVLMIHDGRARPTHLELLHKALLFAGLNPTLGQNENIPQGLVVIAVAIKP